jgi:hypothetical protein
VIVESPTDTPSPTGTAIKTSTPTSTSTKTLTPTKTIDYGATQTWLMGDLDNDDLSNETEMAIGTDPNDPDTDNDGMPDGWEFLNKIDPKRIDANEDPDNDCRSNYQEFVDNKSPKSPDDVTVPNIVGRKLSEGESELKNSCLQLGEVTYQYTRDQGDGYIFKMEPSSGGERSPGEQVNVWVSFWSGFIVNKYSGKCIDVMGSPGTAEGSRIQLWSCEYSDPNTDQKWKLELNGYFINTLPTNMCLGMIGGGPLIDNFFYLSNCDGSTSYQPIELVLENDGLIKFKNLIWSNEQYCLHAQQLTDEGAIEAGPCNNSIPNAVWELKRAP